jgi:hypothetical protein
MASERSRFNGTPATYASIISKFVIAPGFIEGDECSKVDDAKVDIKSIEASHGLLAAQYAVQPNMSFNKSIIKGALELILDERNEAWIDKASGQYFRVSSINMFLYWRENMCNLIIKSEIGNRSPWKGTLVSCTSFI